MLEVRIHFTWQIFAFEDTLLRSDDHHFKAAVGKFLYPVLCRFFFQTHSKVAPQLSVQLCTFVCKTSLCWLYALFASDGIIRLTLC